MKIEILGSSGCSTCEGLKDDVERITREMDKEEEVEIVKVEDPQKFASYGIMTSPALVVDGEVAFKGRVPSDREIRDLLS